MAIKIETPAVPKGTQEQQMRQIYSFLFRLSEKLNVALNNLTEDNFSSATQMKLNSAGSTNVVTGGSNKADIQKTYNELKSLIINTAEYIESVKNELYLKLESQYTAVSGEWGTFQETIKTIITAEAEATVSNYNYESRLDALDQAAAGFREYIITSEGFIKQGFIDYDEDGVPIVGIAIGQNIRSHAVDGIEYDKIDGNQSCAFYTADKVSFRIGGQEVAYISNNKLFIMDIEINGKLYLKGKWIISISDDDSFAIDWFGGDD